jgi:hypothetical protein
MARGHAGEEKERGSITVEGESPTDTRCAMRRARQQFDLLHIYGHCSYKMEASSYATPPKRMKYFGECLSFLVADHSGRAV